MNEKKYVYHLRAVYQDVMVTTRLTLVSFMALRVADIDWV